MISKCREKVPFVVEEPRPKSEVVTYCIERINEGCIKQEERKKVLVTAMDKHGPEEMFWQPLSKKGWGASPFNPNCWRTKKDGDRVFSSEVWDKVNEELRKLRETGCLS